VSLAWNPKGSPEGHQVWRIVASFEGRGSRSLGLLRLRRELGWKGPRNSSRRATGGLRRSGWFGVAQVVPAGSALIFGSFAGCVRRLVSVRFTAEYRSSLDYPGRHLWFRSWFFAAGRGLWIPRGGFGRCTPETNAALLKFVSLAARVERERQKSRVRCSRCSRSLGATLAGVSVIRFRGAACRDLAEGPRSFADGNPDTLASATSRCVECLVILSRVACGEG